MSRLIDADKLFEYIQKEKAWKQGTMKRPRYDLGKYHAYYEMLKIIEKQPTVILEQSADENPLIDPKIKSALLLGANATYRCNCSRIYEGMDNKCEHIDVDDIIDILTNLAKEYENPPLMLDELREMEGEPVYVVGKTPFNSEYTLWLVIGLCGMGDRVITFTDGRDLLVSNYGRTWLAYRRKLEV